MVHPFRRFLQALLAVTLTCGLAAAAPTSPTQTLTPDRLVFAFQKQSDPRVMQQNAERVAAFLTDRIGMPVDVLIPASYGATVQAMIAAKAHVGYMDSLPFLLARAEAPVRLILAEQRGERTDYDSVYVVARDSDAKSLEDLRGRRMMFTSPTSTSGYLMAYSRLVDEKFLKRAEDPARFFGSVNYGGSYANALRAVLNGQADAAAVSDYTMEGPRVDVYLTPEERARLRVLTETPWVPTHIVALRADLPAALQGRIKSALLELSREQPESLADVYGAAKLVEVDEERHVRGTVNALRNTGIKLEALVKP